MQTRFAFLAVFAWAAISTSQGAFAKDDLLETLAQKGVITMAEYEKLKAQRKTEVTMTTDDGIRLTSADNSTSIQFGTLQQFDAADYDEDNAKLSNGTDLRRSRFSINGNFLTDWQYRVEYEFVGTAGITDAYVAYARYKPFTVTAGQFKQPFGMEALAQDKGVTFMERGLPFAFVTTRAPGLMLSSSGTHWTAAGGVFGEPVGNANTAPAGDEGYGVVGRTTWAPFSQDNHVLHFGLGYVYRQPTQDNSTNATGAKYRTVRFRSKPESNVLAQRFVDTGELVNVNSYTIGGLELGMQWNALSWQNEYQWTDVDRKTTDDLRFDGWYSQIAYTLTGEPRPYRTDRGIFDGVRPNRNFGADGWGAFEIAFRLSGIDLTNENINGGRERDATYGLNWYLNQFLRLSFNIVEVLDVDGGPLDGEQPTIYQMRFQIAL
jgi:phosphate-selective porin OprO and OprP